MPDGFENETFPIPLYPGVRGTPKMVKWLSDEVGRRYRNIHGITPHIKKIQARKEGSDEIYCTLDSDDVIEHVVESNALLVALCE